MVSKLLPNIGMRSPLFRLSTLKADKELNKWRIVLGEERVDEFSNAFSKLSNEKLKPENEIIVSLVSIQDNFESIFGVKNDFLAKCIYYYLTDGYLDKDIKLPEFIKKFLCFGTYMKKDFYNFIFNFLDVNKDGQVTMIDLIFFYTYLPMNTQFGAEIAETIEIFSKKFILNKGRRPGAINIEIFKSLYPELPCLVAEIMSKLFRKEPTMDMIKLNVVNGEKSCLKVDPRLTAKKNSKLLYNLFDEKFQMN